MVEQFFQPVFDEQWYLNGVRSRSTMTALEAQESLDNNQQLTSDQYDSFWEGWYAAGREIVNVN